jgi:ankyrin repeat protein
MLGVGIDAESSSDDDEDDAAFVDVNETEEVAAPGSEAGAVGMVDEAERSFPRFAGHIPELEEPEELVQPARPASPEAAPEPEPAKPPKLDPDRVRELLTYAGTNNITLHMTVEKQIFEMTKQIVDLDPSQIKTLNDQAQVPFFAAAMNGKAELLPLIHEAAIRHFGPVEGPKYTTHWRWTKQGAVTLLHHAALNDFEELTEWLCAHGADVDSWSRSSNPVHPPFTPLMMACKHNCTRAACALVNAGADVNVRVPDGKGGGDLTPLHITIQLNFTDLAAFLFSKGARNTCTFGCTKCRMHSKWMARRLITMRENIQARLAAEEREAARKQEMEDVMQELNFVDFLSEMKKLAGGFDSSVSQDLGDATIEEQADTQQLAGVGDASCPRAGGPSSARKQQVRKKTTGKKKKGGKKGRR